MEINNFLIESTECLDGTCNLTIEYYNQNKQILQ